MFAQTPFRLHYLVYHMTHRIQPSTILHSTLHFFAILPFFHIVLAHMIQPVTQLTRISNRYTHSLVNSSYFFLDHIPSPSILYYIFILAVTCD